MCIEFARSSGSYDFFSPVINCVGNGVVLAVAGMATTAIVALALQALGYSGKTIALGTAIPRAVGIVGIVAAVAGSLALCAIVYVIFSALLSR